MRLVLISLSVVLVLGLGLFILQFSASGPTPLNLKHPWTQTRPWTFVRIKTCPENIQELKALPPTLKASEIWWLDVRWDKNESEWKVFCSADSIATLKQQDFGQEFKLSEVLEVEGAAASNLLLNVHTRNDSDTNSFLNALKNYEASPKIGLISPVRRIMLELRKRRPQWIFGSDFPSLAKALTFHSLGLLGLVDLWPDFYVIPNTLTSSVEEKRSLAADLEKQGKIVSTESEHIRYVIFAQGSVAPL